MGYVREAVPSYERAVALAPESGLLRVELAQALIELDDRTADQRAIEQLNDALVQEQRSGTPWRLLSVAYHRTGNRGMSSLALAERASLNGRADEAIARAAVAERDLPTGSPGWLRAQDIQSTAQRSLKKQRKGRRR